MVRRLSMSLSAVMPLVFFVRMIHSGVKPDSYTFPFLFKSCAKLASSHGGKQIRAYVLKLGFCLMCIFIIRSSSMPIWCLIKVI